MKKTHGVLAFFPYVPWCCLGSLLILSFSSLVVLQPAADAASFLIVVVWGVLLAEISVAIGSGHIPRSLCFSLAACVVATGLHAAVIQMTGRDCVVVQGLRYLYWQAFISPDAPLHCSWCAG